MYGYLRDLYISGVIDDSYLDIAVEMEMITSKERDLIKQSK